MEKDKTIEQQTENEYKITKKIVIEISKNDKKILELVRVAKEIILKEDELLFKELAKH